MWYPGNVSDAIMEAKRKGSLLLVFVVSANADDVGSREMQSLWESEAVSSECARNGVVAMRLVYGTLPATQFAQIYPVIKVPVSFLISNDGKPLEVVMGGPGTIQIDADILLQKLTNAIQEVGSRAGTAPSSSSGQSDIEAKVAKAKELIEARRVQKEKKEMEDEKNRERQRIDEGKEMMKTKERIQEMEIRQAAEERRKQKLESAAALKKLREQIAIDRTEKQEKFNSMKADAAREAENKRKLKQEELLKKDMEDQALRSNTARIQCRFATGQSIQNEFDAENTLSDVANFVRNSGKLAAGEDEFTLVQMYPRREFSIAVDYGKSLRSLALSPSAVLVVLPKSGRLVQQPPSGGSTITLYASALFAFVIAQLIWFRNTVYSLLGYNVDQRRINSSNGGQPQGTVGRSSNRSFGRNEGAVRRFPTANAGEDDEDMGTWNGNSTQQL